MCDLCSFFFIFVKAQYQQYGLVGDGHDAHAMMKPGMPNTMHLNAHTNQAQQGQHHAQQSQLHDDGHLQMHGQNAAHQQHHGDHEHQTHLNDPHAHGMTQNDEVASRYGISLPVQPGYAPHNAYASPPSRPQYAPGPAVQPQYIPRPQYAPQPQPHYVPQPQYAPAPQPQYAPAPQYAAPTIPYGSYSYPSPSPHVPCGSNLLFSCAPRVQQVPCSQSYGSYGQPIVPSLDYGTYRAADENTLGVSMLPDDGSVPQPNQQHHQQTNQQHHQQPTPTPNPNANASTNSNHTTNNSTTDSNTPIKKIPGISTDPARLGDAPKDMSFNANNLNSDGATQIEDAERKLDKEKEEEKHKKPIAVHHVPVFIPPKPQPPLPYVPYQPQYQYQQPHHQHHIAHQVAYRDGSGNMQPNPMIPNDDGSKTMTNAW